MSRRRPAASRSAEIDALEPEQIGDSAADGDRAVVVRPVPAGAPKPSVLARRGFGPYRRHIGSDRRQGADVQDELINQETAAQAPRSWPRMVAHHVRTAPLTYTWLTILLMTTLIKHSLPRASLRHLLEQRSTNLHHLASDPIRVLISSLFWIDGYYWWPYLVLFGVFLAPAERWLGSVRWLIAGLVAHIGATYLSEGYLYLLIQDAAVSPKLLNTRDIGVSYFVVGVLALLSYHIARPWRWVYLGAMVLLFATQFGVTPSFTPLGHLCALLIGLCLYPLTRARPPPWNPGHPTRLWHRLRRRPPAAA